MDNAPFVIGEQTLDTAMFTAITAGRRKASLGVAARERVAKCLAFRRRLEGGNTRIYGVNTGFGKLADTVIPAPQLADLQRNLVRSHAVGWGPALSRPEARGMLLLRARRRSPSSVPWSRRRRPFPRGGTTCRRRLPR